MAGGLLSYHAGTIVTTRSGELVVGPGVFTAAAIGWVFVTMVVLWRRLRGSGRV